MPEDIAFRPSQELLQDDEILRLATIFAELGFHKFRLTGGEPTIRANVVELVAGIAAIDGVRTVAMTTNGVMLAELAKPLAQAGLQRVNVSIDTLDPEKFHRLTRWGQVDDVFAGIWAAQAAGLQLKLNSVVVRGVNDKQDAIDLARLTIDNAWQLRFIEMMPFGDVADFQQAGIVPEAELRQTISAALGEMQLLNNGQLDGEARLYKLPNALGSIGFISSVTQPFCASCSRARLTADGRLRLCLLRENEVDLMTPLRDGASDDQLKNLITEGVWQKPWGHGLAEEIIPLNRVMSEIGG